MTAVNPIPMPPPLETLRTVYLHPGQIFTATQPLLVSTILGSCIAVCLWDEATSVAGINHYLLPNDPVRGHSDLRYGNISIERLINEMLGAGATMTRIVARLAGGASILGPGSSSRLSIGDQNVAVAREVLQKHGLPIIAEHTGGQRGRKLVFHTGNGCAYIKEI